MTHYYLDAGAGGLAVGVHSTQFAIREVSLYKPVLELALQTAQEWAPLAGARPLFMIAGMASKTAQAQREALTARESRPPFRPKPHWTWLAVDKACR